MPDEFYKMPGSDKPDNGSGITDEEQALIDRFAHWVVRRGLTVPAIMFIETGKPLNWLGSQAMLIGEPAVWGLEPLLKAVFGLHHKDYLTFQKLLEKRHSMEAIIQTIEKFDAEARIEEDKVRRQTKEKRKEIRHRRKARRQKLLRRLLGRELPGDR
jgi:hypothetical protein